MNTAMESEIAQVTALYNMIANYLVNYSFQIVGAIFIFLVGLFIAKKAANLVQSLCKKHHIDTTLSSFVASAVKIIILALVAVMALGKIGISITPLLATIGAVSLGAGLAVQGLVSNYGAGLSIIVSRPFVVGDTIEVNNVKGLVKEVHLGYTLLVDEDETEIMVPNRHIVGEVIKNSLADMLIETTIGVHYGNSPKQAVELIENALKASDVLSQERPIRVGVKAFGQSSIDIGIRVWAPTQNYYSARYTVNLLIYETLLANDIDVPYPRREVTLLKP